MSRVKKIIVAFSIAATLLAVIPSDADADGPLRRWWRGRKAKQSACSTCATPAAAPNAYNLQPGQCMTTCQKTCTRTVVNYVPCTSYRTCYKKVAVTSYKPVTNTDPCTGCTVTCMKPCTTYAYQAQRVPYTTYRPVYRTETYKVPVTTITNNCSTGTCSTCPTPTAAAGCSTCGTGVAPGYSPTLAPVQNFAPSSVPAPGPTTSTYLENASPANQVPTLLKGVDPQASQRPVIDRFNSGSYNYKASAPTQNVTPATIRLEDKTARSPVRKQWSYAPVRLASYQAPTARPSISRGRLSVQPRNLQPIQRSSVNRTSGWVEVN